jgi:hypothetical protein
VDPCGDESRRGATKTCNSLLAPLISTTVLAESENAEFLEGSQRLFEAFQGHAGGEGVYNALDADRRDQLFCYGMRPLRIAGVQKCRNLNAPNGSAPGARIC